MKSILSVFILLTVVMSSGYAQDTIQVSTGWNIIGSVKDGAVPDVLSTVPDSIITTAFFGYSPGSGYESTDLLDKGFGYWVKVKSDGIIIFNTAQAIDTCRSKAFVYLGKLYNTVSVGNQCWMAENLDVGTMVAGEANQADNDTTEKYCYSDDPLNCALYGGLYQWTEAMRYVTTPGAQGICPAGWHIPTLAEFETLSSTVGGDGNALKAVGQGSIGGAGTNTSGFSALFPGSRDYYGFFDYLGSSAYFWASTEVDAVIAIYLTMDGSSGSISFNNDYKVGGFSVRCVED